MIFRCFLLLCVIATLFEVVLVEAGEIQLEKNKVHFEDRTNLAAKIVEKIIVKIFAEAAHNCLSEAAEHCKYHFKHPTQALECGKQFLRNNRGRCAISK